jgi:hypothetical protein
MSIPLGNVPTWIAALGTVGALSAALWQINTERKRRIAQETADRAERHQAQARLVAAWVGRPVRPESQGEPSDRPEGRTPIYLFNGSSEPVYTLVAAIVFIQGAAPRSTEEVLKAAHPEGGNALYSQAPITTLSILPPGKWRVWIPGTHWSGVLAGRSGGELAFTDRAGAHWIRRALGALEELPQAPFDYFAKWQLYGPYELEVPEPAES